MLALVGRMTRDELRYTQAIKQLLYFQPSCQPQLQGQNGEREADFHQLCDLASSKQKA